MPYITVNMDDGYTKEIRIANVKRLFQNSEGKWALETNSGETGTTSKKAYKQIAKARPEVIEQHISLDELFARLDKEMGEED